jgi:uncharacterized protein
MREALMSLRKVYYRAKNTTHSRDAKGNTDLMLAVKDENAELVHHLLIGAKKLDINNQNNDGETALALAMERGNMTIINDLLRAGADVNAISRSTLLYVAAINGHIDVVRKLIDAKVDVNKGDVLSGVISCGSQVLNIEARNQLVEILLKAGAKVDMLGQDDTFPLEFAVSRGLTQIVKMLLAAGANVNIPVKHIRLGDTLTPLMIAARSGHDDIFDILMEAGADIDVQTVKLKKTALIMAIESVDLTLTIVSPDKIWRAERIALKLIYANADIHLRDSDGQSALDHAIQSKLVSVVRLLVEKGAERQHEDPKQAEIEAILRNAKVQLKSGNKGYLGNLGTFKKTEKSRKNTSKTVDLQPKMNI